MHLTRRDTRPHIPRYVKQVTVTAVTAALLLAGVAPAAASVSARTADSRVTVADGVYGPTALQDAIAAAASKDEALYGAATWARFTDALAVVEAVAARETGGEVITDEELDTVLNPFYQAEFGLLLMAPLHDALDDFEALDPAHYASFEFAELQVIAAAVSQTIDDSSDPAKIDDAAPNWVNMYAAKKFELLDIRAVTSVMDRIDAVDAGSYTAFSVAAAVGARSAFASLLATHNFDSDAEISDIVVALETYEADLVSLVALKGNVAAIDDMTVHGYMKASWDALIDKVDAGKSLLVAASSPITEVTRAEVTAANTAITNAISSLVARPAYNPQTVAGLQALVDSLKYAGNPVTLPTHTDQGSVITYTATGSAAVDGVALRSVGPGIFTLTWSADQVGTDYDPMTETIMGSLVAYPYILVGDSELEDGDSIKVGTSFTISGEGLMVGTTFGADLHGTVILDEQTADAAGNALLKVFIPMDTAAGVHALRVYGKAVDGTDIDYTVNVNVTVPAGPGGQAGPGGGGADKLPRTGGELIGVTGAILLTTVGGLLMLLTRRKWATR